MRFLKSLLGGILGSAVGVFAYQAISQNLPKHATWAVLIIGLLAGLGVRLLCGMNRSGLTGIVAAATALTALLGFNYYVIASAAQGSRPVIAEHVKFDEDGRPIPAVEDETADGEAAEQERLETSERVADPRPVSDGRTVQVADVFSQPNLAMAQSSPMELAALAMTGFLAYILGRGNAKSTTTTQASMTVEPATEPS